MRRFSSPALVAAGALAWSCTVYDSSLVPTDGSMTTAGGDGPAASSSGSTAKAGSVSVAGTTSTTNGGGYSGQAGTATGGTSELPEGGTGGTSPGATSGAGGSGGRSGNGGTGGAGGGAGKAAMGGTSGTAGAAGTAGTAGKGGAGGSAGASGNGGSGGTAVVVKCADHPLSAKTSWVASASMSSPGNGMESDPLYNPPQHMTDGIDSKRWSSGHWQTGSEWIEIDFGAVVNLTQITMSVFGNDVADYPRAYTVLISDTLQDPVDVVATGVGATGYTTVTWPAPITARLLKVKQTGMVPANGPWWTIAEVNVTCTD